MLAFWDEQRVDIEKQKTILDKCANLATDKESEQVYVVCAGEEEDCFTVSMQELLGCLTVDIVGVIASRTLFNRIGYINQKISGLQNFELLCRLVDVTGQCTAVFEKIVQSDLVVTENEVVTYAYLMKRYLQKIQQWNQTENVLLQMMQITEAFGLKAKFSDYLNRFLSEEDFYREFAWPTAPYVIIRGDDTCYGVLQDFADALAKGLKYIGQPVLVVESGNIDFDYLQNYPCKALVGFQTEAFRLDFFQGIPCFKIQFWLDNPIFYKNKFMTIPKDVWILCQDENYVSYIKDVYHMDNVVHMPPAGYLQPDNHDIDRPYDIVFVGSYSPEKSIQYTGLEKRFYEYMIANPNLTFSEGLHKIYECNEDDIAEILTSLKPVCQKVIDHYRNAVIDTILAAGYQVHVYGESWSKYQSKWRDLLIEHPAISVQDSLVEWQKAKIGLNVMSWHKAGMTERVANIMLSGAACLSDTTTYLQSHMVDGEEIALFRLDELEKLPGQITYLLADNHWREIGQKGAQVARNKHTWECRAGQLHELVTNKCCKVFIEKEGQACISN